MIIIITSIDRHCQEYDDFHHSEPLANSDDLLRRRPLVHIIQIALDDLDIDHLEDQDEKGNNRHTNTPESHHCEVLHIETVLGESTIYIYSSIEVIAMVLSVNVFIYF